MKINKDPEKCDECHFCDLVMCPQKNVNKALIKGTCIGCGACLLACPQEALSLKENILPETEVWVNNNPIKAKGTVKNALKVAGVKISKFPRADSIFMPCECGGCWTCTVKVDNKIALSCLTPLYEGMRIETTPSNIPLRVVSGFGAHQVGGVGTPYWKKSRGKAIEIAAFTHGCNLRCPQCQNYQMAFTAAGHLLEAQEAAQILMGLKNSYKVDCIAISGGECTLNREWLIRLLERLRLMDDKVELHVDTNGTILTPDYVDDLAKAGMTQLGVDLKAQELSTFQHITGIQDEELAELYLQTSWQAVEYVTENYEDIFLGIGIPFNRELISLEELLRIGEEIYRIKKDVQVCVLDYRPEFRRKELLRPSTEEMIKVKKMFNDLGLEVVIVQTNKGHFGP